MSASDTKHIDQDRLIRLGSVSGCLFSLVWFAYSLQDYENS